jgi:hypothetical protein
MTKIKTYDFEEWLEHKSIYNLDTAEMLKDEIKQYLMFQKSGLKYYDDFFARLDRGVCPECGGSGDIWNAKEQHYEDCDECRG